MASLLVVKQYITNFIGRYEVYLKPLGKFLLAMLAFMTINSKLGYMHKIDSFAIVLIAALLCSVLPTNFIVLLSAVFIILHMYALSLECAIVVIVLFIILFLLYFGLSSKDGVSAVMSGLLTSMGIPYIMPVTMGLVGGPTSIVSVGCGVMTSMIIKTIKANATALMAMETEDMTAKLRFVIDAVLDNKIAILMVFSFAVTLLVVYFVRQLSIDFSWPIAIGSGAIIDAIIVLVGDLSMNSSVSIAGLLIGTVLAIVVGLIVQFFKFNVNYNKTEKVEFEDDEYFYYVKAVPKRTVAVPTRNVKKINSSKKVVRK
ncbi:MAG: hypothetical protein MJZ11_05960 [Lachnospiraceae bacterium]|nr:hypothetical protein [Lachnospiraceae bacterium]